MVKICHEKIHYSLNYYNYCAFFLQNKSKRPEVKSPGGAQGGKDNVLAPDTGQSQTPEKTAEPPAAAAASSSSPVTNNNNSNNYNLVTSLLNLTKSPVSNIEVYGFRFNSD